MKNVKNQLLIVSSLLLMLAFGACENSVNDLGDKTKESSTSISDYTAILEILDLSEIAEVTNESALKSMTSTDSFPCFEVSVHENDTAFWPRSWTFTYSDDSCTDYFGNVKQGSIHITLTDFWKNEGSLRTVTFENFKINGNSLEGTRTILNTGMNESDNLTFERKFEDASFTRGDTATIYWSSTKNVEMVAGYSTFFAADDEYLVSGSVEGTNYDGNAFTITITEPLLYAKCSRYPVSGAISIESEGGQSIDINYGDGTCDDLAQVTVDGITSEVQISFN